MHKKMKGTRIETVKKLGSCEFKSFLNHLRVCTKLVTKYIARDRHICNVPFNRE